MITSELNLSMAIPTIEQAYAKKGDSGRVLKINLIDAEPENGTLRIRRPDGVEVTSDAENGVSESGDVVTFEAYEEVPLEKLEVDLEPVQNLNGYDAPWVGGAGKNLLQLTGRTIITSGQYENTTPRDFSVPSAYIGITMNNYFQNARITSYSIAENSIVVNSSMNGYGVGLTVDCEASTQYVVSYENKALNQVGIGFFNSSGEFLSFQNININSAWTFTTPSNCVHMMVVFRPSESNLGTNYTYNMPQLEKGSTATTYAPYSNICPIYPSNGKNLLDSSVLQQGGIASATGAESPSDARVRTPFIFLKGGSYTVSSKNNLYSVFDVYDTNQSYLQAESFTTFSASPKTYTINGDRYVRIVFRNSGGTNITPSEVNGEQLEYGSTATPYVPYQGINIYQSGVNLWDGEWESGSIDGSTGANESSSSNWRTKGVIPIFPNETYYVACSVTGALRGRFYGKDGTYLGTNDKESQDLRTNRTFIAPSNAYYVRFAPSTSVITTKEVSVNYPSTETDYEPYNGTTYPLSLGRDVYGGTLDVVSGKLVVDKVFKLVDGSSSTGWNRIATYGTSTRFDFSISDIKYDSGANTLTNMFSKITIGTASAVGFSVHASSHLFQIQVPTDTADTVADLMTYFSANNLQIVYVLDTPLEYDLTPQQIQTLLGTNNIWSSGLIDVAFQYDSLFADIPSSATQVVGNCLADVNFTDISTLPFVFTVKENQA